MNSSLRNALSFCIGVAGMTVWTGGVLVTLKALAVIGYDAVHGSPLLYPKKWEDLAAGLGAWLVGYSMTVLAVFVRRKPEQLWRLIRIELTAQISAMVASFGIYALQFSWHRDSPAAWTFGAVFLASAAVLVISGRKLSRVPPEKRLLSGRVFDDDSTPRKAPTAPGSLRLRKVPLSPPGPLPCHRVLLLQLFLGVPGTILEIAGGIVMAAVGPVVAGDWQQSLYMPALILAGGFGSFLIGHLMMVMQQLLTDTPRYRMEGRLIPYFVGLEIGAHFLAILALSLFFICMGVERSDPARKALVFGLAAVAVAWLTGEAFNRLGQIRKKWQDEFEKVGRQVPG